MTALPLHRLIPAILLIFVAGCGGGGGGGGGGGDVADGGIGGTGISTGAVTGRGSIIVNGRRFALDSAAITVNDSPADDSALRIGRVVTIDGDLTNGIAERVAFVPRLVGPVDNDSTALDCDAGTGSLTVMRQTVLIRPSTIVECGAGNLIGSGQRVLVSGYRRQNGDLAASYLEALGDGTFPVDQIIGRAGSNTNGGFTIGGLDIAAADNPEVGERVRVRGSYDTDTQVLTAQRVIDAPPVVAEAGQAAEVEGLVDNFQNADSFQVNGIPIDASGARIEDTLGGDATGRLRTDVEVEVEGRFNASGTLVADRVEVELDDNVAIFADASSADPEGRIVRFFSDELAVEITDGTRLKDDSDADIDDFGIDNIAPGDRLDLEGFTLGDDVGASRIDREEAAAGVTLEAPVEAIDKTPDQETVTVLGLDPIDVSQAVDNGDSIADIEVGDIVEIVWINFNSLADPADEVDG